MYQVCKFNKDTDLCKTVPGLSTDLCLAIDNGVVLDTGIDASYNDVDVSFINNSEVVSNVLLEYQNELDIYEYTYVKGVDTYYLESIKK